MHIAVVSRRDPRHLIHEAHLSDLEPDALTEKCKAEFQKITEEEMLVMCCDSWQAQALKGAAEVGMRNRL